MLRRSERSRHGSTSIVESEGGRRDVGEIARRDLSERRSIDLFDNVDVVDGFSVVLPDRSDVGGPKRPVLALRFLRLFGHFAGQNHTPRCALRAPVFGVETAFSHRDFL